MGTYLPEKISFEGTNPSTQIWNPTFNTITTFQAYSLIDTYLSNTTMIMIMAGTSMKAAMKEFMKILPPSTSTPKANP